MNNKVVVSYAWTGPSSSLVIPIVPRLTAAKFKVLQFGARDPANTGIPMLILSFTYLASSENSYLSLKSVDSMAASVTYGGVGYMHMMEFPEHEIVGGKNISGTVFKASVTDASGNTPVALNNMLFAFIIEFY
jgi:hypothetical protein